MPLRNFFRKLSKPEDDERGSGGRGDEGPARADPPAKKLSRSAEPVERLPRVDPQVEAVVSMGEAGDHLESRTRRAVESLLENESLTADLDDAAAKELLDWGIAHAKEIISDTADMDDEGAEEAMYPRMSAP